MDVFIYQAAVYCEEHGKARRAQLTAAGKAPADIDNESTYDSDAFPKGPYSDGGGEADSPQNCDDCGLFLENPLTTDGYEYVRSAAAEFVTEGADESWSVVAAKARSAGNDVIAEWIEFYLAPRMA